MQTTFSIYFKLILSLFLSALLAYAVGLYGNLPWWSFVMTNFIISIILVQKPVNAFLSGALGIGLLWLGLSLVIDNQNQHLLSTKVANILPLNGSFSKLIAITTLIGFLLGGFASLTGSFIRKAK
jgi:hypothetical protein